LDREERMTLKEVTRAVRLKDLIADRRYGWGPPNPDKSWVAHGRAQRQRKI
jgi:hypothetical protein